MVIGSRLALPANPIMNAGLFMCGEQGKNVAAATCFRRSREVTARWITETEFAVGRFTEAESPFMHQPVMVAALCRPSDYAAWDSVSG